ALALRIAPIRRRCGERHWRLCEGTLSHWPCLAGAGANPADVERSRTGSGACFGRAAAGCTDGRALAGNARPVRESRGARLDSTPGILANGVVPTHRVQRFAAAERAVGVAWADAARTFHLNNHAIAHP